MTKKIRIGALISGGGTNLQAIIDACESGGIQGEMAFVGTDTPDAKGLERSRRHGIPNFTVNYNAVVQEFKSNRSSVPLPVDFDLSEILAKQSLFSKNAAPEKLETFFSTRAIAESRLLEKMKAYLFH